MKVAKQCHSIKEYKSKSSYTTVKDLIWGIFLRMDFYD